MSATDQIRALADSGTAGPWTVDPDRWFPPAWAGSTMGYLRVVAGEPNELSGICQPVVSTNGAALHSPEDAANHADAAKIVAAVNALPKVADLIEATANHVPLDGLADFPVCCACPNLTEHPCDVARARDALTAALGVTE